MAKWFSSLRVRLVLLVLLAALPALLLTIYSNTEQRKLAEASVEKEILRLSQLATINQETFVENTRIFLIALSHMPAVRSPDLSECQDLFSHLFSEHYPQFASFYVADLNAHVVCSAPNTHVPSRLARVRALQPDGRQPGLRGQQLPYLRIVRRRHHGDGLPYLRL